MIGKSILTFIFVSLLVLTTPEIVWAKSGCCSGHKGVNCSAGAQGNGKVICKDGWKGSSCLYKEMVMCGGTQVKQSIKPVASRSPKPKASPKVLRSSPSPLPKCSATSDAICPQSCTAGNDADCCVQLLKTHRWYDNWGCYPR